MKRFFPIGSLASDIFVTIYLTATLYVRFLLEAQLNGHILASVALGAFALLFLWALTKSKIIKPSFFGLLPVKDEEEDEPKEG